MIWTCICYHTTCYTTMNCLYHSRDQVLDKKISLRSCIYRDYTVYEYTQLPICNRGIKLYKDHCSTCMPCLVCVYGSRRLNADICPHVFQSPLHLGYDFIACCLYLFTIDQHEKWYGIAHYFDQVPSSETGCFVSKKCRICKYTLHSKLHTFKFY